MTTRTLITAQEFAQMNIPETEDYELVEGELIALPGATSMHAKIRRRVERLVENISSKIRLASRLVRSIAASRAIPCAGPMYLYSFSLQQIDLNKIPVPFAADIAAEVLSNDVLESLLLPGFSAAAGSLLTGL